MVSYNLMIMPSVPFPETEDKLEWQISGLKNDCSLLGNLVLTSHLQENFWNSICLRNKTIILILVSYGRWNMLTRSGHYERVDYNVGMSGFLNQGDTPWYFPCKRPPHISVHHYVSPCIFCGHLQLAKMTLGLLTTTDSVHLAVWASSKTCFFAPQPPIKISCSH